MKIEKLRKERDFTIELAQEAGGIIRAGFRLGREKETKRDKTFVTDTDKEINSMILARIRERHPKHDIRAEEGDSPAKSIYSWYCDPLDGTILFTHGVSGCTFSLVLEKRGVPIMGVVYDPFNDRMLSAIENDGAFMNGKKIHVSDSKSLKGTVIGLSFWNGAQFDITSMAGRLINDGANVLMLGSIVQQGIMVAVGEFAGAVHPSRLPHDSAALRVIIREAHGNVTNILGEDQIKYNQRIRGAIMSNGLVHERLVELTGLKRN